MSLLIESQKFCEIERDKSDRSGKTLQGLDVLR